MAFTCILLTNTCLVGRRWDFNGKRENIAIFAISLENGEQDKTNNEAVGNNFVFMSSG